ncbi:MAG: hypothetical protein O6940_06410 [Ignavibacteria bacterium]|nr:hypothetical protein [Ignavibacteria bacterium]
MPGITFYYNKESFSSIGKDVIDDSLKSLLFTERYALTIFIEEKNYFVSCTKYPVYPAEILRTDKHLIIIEGKIYNKSKSELKEELEGLAQTIFDESNKNKEDLTEWLHNADGEFIVVIQNLANKQIAIFNDSLGRLALYSYQNDYNLVITREISFILNLSLPIQIDSMGIAQFLFFGYPLHTRTLYEQIKRVQPGTLFIVDVENNYIKTMNVHKYNLDNKIDELPDMETILNNMEDLFLTASKNRCAEGFENILSLSGGLDSRAVLAALEKASINYKAYTFTKDDKSNQDDVNISEDLSKLFNMDWNLLQLDEAEQKDIFFLLETKRGMNDLGNNFMVQFLRRLLGKLGNKLLYLTGDGGHRVLPSQLPAVKLNSLDQLVKYVISSRSSLFTLTNVLKITGINYNDFYNELFNVLNNYSEKIIANKYVHFVIFGRGLKWLFEGEDRNRYWFWSITPFYSQPFFNYSMMLPDSIKENYNLQKQFLVRLSPKAAAENNALWRLPITSNKLKVILFAKDNVYPRLPLFMKRFVNRYFNKVTINKNFQKETEPYLTKLLGNDNELNNKLNLTFLMKINYISTFETEHVLTLLKVLIKLKENTARYSN